MLSGVIKSIEDHGYIVDFATGDKTGFLLKKNAAEFVKNQMKGKSLCLGQVVQCLVLDGANARTIPVTINPSKVCDSVVPSDHKMGIKSLLPGLLVTATVKEVSSLCLSCSPPPPSSLFYSIFLSSLGGGEGEPYFSLLTISSALSFPSPSLSGGL